MSETDHFLLTGPDHHTSLAGSIKEETEFHDVSLAYEDQQLGAHKVVLAASSPKLRSILLSNPHPHPVIYLTGVQFPILENILRFIYTGKVIISPEQVNTFLDVAQELDVKGLEAPSGDEMSTDHRDRENIEPPATIIIITRDRNDLNLRREQGPDAEKSKPPATARRYEEYVESEDEEKDLKPKVLKSEVITKSEERSVEPDRKYQEYMENTEDIKELAEGVTDTRKQQPSSQETPEDENCNITTVSHVQLPNVEEEEVVRPQLENMNTEDIAEAEEEDGDDEDYEDGDELEGSDVTGGGEDNKTCPYCQKISPSPSKLQRHIVTHTKERPFRCQLCVKNSLRSITSRITSMLSIWEIPTDVQTAIKHSAFQVTSGGISGLNTRSSSCPAEETVCPFRQCEG